MQQGDSSESYRAARKIIKADGIVGNVLHLLDALTVVNGQRILQDIRLVARGE